MMKEITTNSESLKSFTEFLDTIPDLSGSGPYEGWPETDLAVACQKVYNCKEGQRPRIAIDHTIIEDELCRKDVKSFSLDSIDGNTFMELQEKIKGLDIVAKSIISVLVQDPHNMPLATDMATLVQSIPKDAIWGLANDKSISAPFHADILIFKR